MRSNDMFIFFMSMFSKMRITVLGSCRQHSLQNKYSLTSIQEELSYPHYTKEILEVIKYCKYNHIDLHETINIFRTPILTQMFPNQAKLNQEFHTTDLFILEISSKKKYIYKDKYLHHIATEAKYNIPIKNEIIIEKQTKDEIEQDILQIKEELNKPFIIVSHIITQNSGDRYDLGCWLEEICIRHNIPFINPVKEIIKRNKRVELPIMRRTIGFNMIMNVQKDQTESILLNMENIHTLFVNEPNLNHYTNKGHDIILDIYSEFIKVYK